MSYIYIYLAQVMAAINIVSSKVLVADTSINTLLALRFILASALLFVMHFATKPGGNIAIIKSLSWTDWKFIIAQSLCAGLLFNFFMYQGLKYISASIAGIITSSLPAMVSILGFIILKDKLSSKHKWCIGLVTLGLVIINSSNGHGTDSASVANTQYLGTLLVLIALVPEAIYYLLHRIHAFNMPIFLLSAIVNLINGLILLPFSYADIIPTLYSYNSLEWFDLIILSASSGLFYVFWYLGAKNISSVIAALSTAFMPINTLIIAWVFLSETINLWQGIGMSLVILSIIISSRR